MNPAPAPPELLSIFPSGKIEVRTMPARRCRRALLPPLAPPGRLRGGDFCGGLVAVESLDRGNEPVSDLGQGLDKPALFR